MILVRFLVCVFLLLASIPGFAVEIPDWVDLFQNKKADAFTLPLTSDISFFVKVPPGFHYVNSHDTVNGSLLEFVPDGETVDNWTQIHTVILFPRPVKNFERFVKDHSGPRFPVYMEKLSFMDEEGIKTFCYFWETQAIKFPELQVIEGMDESTMKLGFQGDKALYIVAHSIRYDHEATNDQIIEALDSAFQLLIDSFDIIGADL